MNRKERRAAEKLGQTGRAYPPGGPRAGADFFRTGLAHHQAGRLREAEALYRQTITVEPNHADALHLLGVIASQVGRHEVAVELIDLAIRQDGKNSTYHSNRGLALAGLQRFDDALASFDRALALRPDRADVLYNRGNTLKDLGRLDEALASYDRALAARPDYLEALLNRGVVLQELGRLDAALASYDRALLVRPDFAEALSNRGNVLKALGRLDAALASYDRALAARPDDVEALFNRGVALRDLGRPAEALASYDQALAARADYAEALCNRGVVLQDLGRLDQALTSFDRALVVRTDYAEALSNRGNALKALRRFDGALASYDRALALRPDYAEALSNRGLVLQVLGRIDEALASYDRALIARPDFADALSNRGGALEEVRRFDEALECYDRVLALAPDHAKAGLNRAFLLLLTGAFAEGWPAYEWRRKIDNWVPRTFAGSEWSGDDPAGQRLLLYAEQGFGDTIQFVRYARLAAARGAQVILEVQPPLRELLAGSGCAETIVATGETMPPFDLHCPLLSLPRMFATTAATIPADIPYIRPPPGRLDAWKRRLPSGALRIGLAWSGHPANARDHDRSIPFAQFAALLAVPGVRFVSLQKDVRASDAAAFDGCAAIDLRHELMDFADTAAVIAHLDLVITVDTAVAHLAGAMGKPVWILLPCVPDFRWLIDRDTSPWYPSARLFRKSQAGDWADVIARVARELAGHCAA